MPVSRSRVLVATAVLAILAACGGSSDTGGTTDPGTTPPVATVDPGPGPGPITPQHVDDPADAATDGTVTADGSSDASADADAEDPPVPATPAIRFVGRFDTTDAAGPVVGWPGARIIARFDGTQASVTLKDTTGGKGNSYWDVIVDDVVQQVPLALTPGQASYPLTSGLAPGIHTVEIYKRTEGQVSRTQFLGFDFGGGTLLAPPAPPGRAIEFIVDSGAIGYGIALVFGTVIGLLLARVKWLDETIGSAVVGLQCRRGRPPRVVAEVAAAEEGVVVPRPARRV